MIKFQEMYNQVNAVIYFLPEEDRNKLPNRLIRFFRDKANCEPEDVIDLNKGLEEQGFNDETIIMLYHINNLIKK